MKLLNDDALNRSSVVANCQMNRECTGELGVAYDSVKIPRIKGKRR